MPHRETVAGEATSRSSGSNMRFCLLLICMISPLMRQSYGEGGGGRRGKEMGNVGGRMEGRKRGGGRGEEGRGKRGGGGGGEGRRNEGGEKGEGKDVPYVILLYKKLIIKNF